MLYYVSFIVDKLVRIFFYINGRYGYTICPLSRMIHSSWTIFLELSFVEENIMPWVFYELCFKKLSDLNFSIFLHRKRSSSSLKFLRSTYAFSAFKRCKISFIEIANNKGPEIHPWGVSLISFWITVIDEHFLRKLNWLLCNMLFFKKICQSTFDDNPNHFGLKVFE